MAEALSIAIPFYSGLEYLELAIRSVLAQEDGRWQLLVVDDSREKEGARELVARLGDARVRYHANAGTLGMVPAWNRCLEEAPGELVTLLHGDDRLLPGYVGEVLALAAAEPEAVALFTGSVTIDAAGKPRRSLQDDIKFVFVPRGDPIRVSGQHGLRALMRGNFIVCPTLCWRKARLGSRRFDPTWRQVQDLALTSELLLAGESLVGTRAKVYAYRRHAGNATARQTESLLRFVEEYRLFDRVAAQAEEHGWRAAARTARAKSIVRLHLLWSTLRALLAGRPGLAARTLGFLVLPDTDAAPASEIERTSSELASGAGATLAVFLLGTALAFVSALLLPRALGTQEFGALRYTLTWAEVLAMLAPFGFDKLLIRELARADGRADHGLMAGILRCAARWTLVGVLVAVALALAFGYGPGPRLDPAFASVFWLVALLIPLRAWANLRHGALLGLGRPAAGMMASSLTHWLVLLPAAALLWAVRGTALSARETGWIAVAAWAVALLVAGRALRARLARAELARVHRIENAREWLRAAVPMLLIVAMAILSLKADVIMLGALRGASEVGIYDTAAQLALLMRIGLVAVNPILSSLVVRARGPQALHAVSRGATRLAFLPALVVAPVLLLGGPWILALCRPDFVAGAAALRILTLGLLLVGALGPMETILVMKGEQRLAALAATGACGLNLLLNAVLIPPLGMEGAALATSVSLLAWGLSMRVALRRRLGLRMGILAR